VSNSKRYIESSSENMANSRNSVNVPDSLDWRTKGVIAPVRNQGALGQSDAFAAVGEY
jgi:C1A family cysteine protease